MMRSVADGEEDGYLPSADALEEGTYAVWSRMDGAPPGCVFLPAARDVSRRWHSTRGDWKPVGGLNGADLEHRYFEYKRAGKDEAELMAVLVRRAPAAQNPWAAFVVQTPARLARAAVTAAGPPQTVTAGGSGADEPLDQIFDDVTDDAPDVNMAPPDPDSPVAVHPHVEFRFGRRARGESQQRGFVRPGQRVHQWRARRHVLVLQE